MKIMISLREILYWSLFNFSNDQMLLNYLDKNVKILNKILKIYQKEIVELFTESNKEIIKYVEIIEYIFE